MHCGGRLSPRSATSEQTRHPKIALGDHHQCTRRSSGATASESAIRPERVVTVDRLSPLAHWATIDATLTHVTKAMLKKADPKHLAFIKELIVSGVESGAFDAALVAPGAEAAFFNGVEQGLRTGRIVTPQGPERLWAFVYFNIEKEKDQPLGFALLRGGDRMVEFWMAAIAPAFRRQGLGRLMFSEALSMVPVKNMLGRCNSKSAAAASLLLRLGFTDLGTGPEGTRFLLGPKSDAATRDAMRRAIERERRA